MHAKECQFIVEEEDFLMKARSFRFQIVRFQNLRFQHVGTEELGGGPTVGAHHVASRRVLANRVLAPCVIAGNLRAAHLGGVLPDKLGEVAGGFGVARAVPVVHGNLIVPSIHGSFAAVVPGSQIFSVWPTGVDQFDVVAVEFFSVVGCVLSQSPVPGERGGRVERSLSVGFVQDFLLERVERRRGAGARGGGA